MTRLWLLFATLAFSCLFLIYRPEGNVTFVLSGTKAPLDTAAYFTYEHIITIILICMILWPPVSHRYMYVLYLVFAGVDMAFFLLYYKSPTFFGIPWNALKCALFGVPLLYETWKDLYQRFHNT